MRLTVAALAIVSLTACSGPGPVSPPGREDLGPAAATPVPPGRGGIASVLVSPIAATIAVGQTERFLAIAMNRNGVPVAAAIQWSSSDPAIASVDPSGQVTGIAPGTARIRASLVSGVFQDATVHVGEGGGGEGSSGSCAASSASTPPAASLLYAQGFESGPVGSESTPGLHVTTHPAVLLEWQASVTRTGRGAYHMRGGNMAEGSSGDATILNDGKSHPFGGLEVWAGGAFCFVSFPWPGTTRPVWLMVTVPTDGVRGADDKPVAAISANGRLRILGSNSGIASELAVSLERGRWYYVVVHGRNGVAKAQELYLYDGTTGALLGTAAVVLNATGSHRARITKWGFGTRQDSSGLEYYLDDIYHATGGTNPGPVGITP